MPANKEFPDQILNSPTFSRPQFRNVLFPDIFPNYSIGEVIKTLFSNLGVLNFIFNIYLLLLKIYIFVSNKDDISYLLLLK